MWLIWLVFIAVVVYFLLMRTRKSSLTGSGSEERPLDILKRRYAAGEITREEFEAKKETIENR